MGRHEGMSRAEEISAVLDLGVAQGGSFRCQWVEKVGSEDVPLAVREFAAEPSGAWASWDDLHSDRLDFARLPAKGKNAAVYFIAETTYSQVTERNRVKECRSIVALAANGQKLGLRSESSLVRKIPTDAWRAMEEQALFEQIWRGSGPNDAAPVISFHELP